MTQLDFYKINHLRALAALWVFAFHIYQFITHEFFQALYLINPVEILVYHGYSAVSFFFCLSGFLFATLYRDSSISTPHFYLKRLIRICPPYLVCVLTYLMIDKGVSPEQYLKAALFVSYPNSMGHLWSIQREMQCYLLFPLLIYLSRSAGPGLLLVYLCAAIVATIVIGISSDSTLIEFYSSLPLRLSQFIMGILLGVWAGNKRCNNRDVWIVMLLFCVGMFLLHYYTWEAPLDKTLYAVIWLSMEGLFYTFLIYAYIHSGLVLPRIIHKGMNYAGLMSYSFFLFHFPVVIFFARNRHFIPDDSLLAYLLLFLISAALAIFSFYLVEAPVLKIKRGIT